MTSTLGRRWRWSHPLTGLSERAGHSQASAGIVRDSLGVLELVAVESWSAPCPLAFRERPRKEGTLFSVRASCEVWPDLGFLPSSLNLWSRAWPAAAPGLFL